MGFDQETCKKNLQSLMWAKGKILVVKDNVFSVNKGFKSQLRRITYPVPVLEEVVKKEKIAQDRSHAIDAQLVRIMKSRKKLS